MVMAELLPVTGIYLCDFSVVFHNRVTISRGVLLCSEGFALKGANSFLEELAPVLGLERPGC